jgi:hypothetical protein
MTRGIFALLIVVELIVIIFLIFQVQDNSNKCKDVRLKEQDRVTKAARLIVQSATQSHPLFAHDHSIEAKLIVDDIINSNGGVVMAEKNLKLAKGKLEILRSQIYEQYQDVQTYLMDKIIEKNPKFDTELNDTAGLRRRKRRKHVTRTRIDRR